MNLYPTTALGYFNVLFVFLRMGSLLLTAPGFSHRAIPPRVKVLMGLSMSVAVYPLVQGYLSAVPETISALLGGAVREVVIGLLMGFVCSFTFEAINLSAQFVAAQIGFGAASLFDPHSEATHSVLVPLYGWIALLIFFIGDYHHTLIKLFVSSFSVAMNHPVNGMESSLAKFIISVVGRLFFIAVQMSAPVTIMILATNALIAILSRTMPQMNILLFSFPVTIVIGLAVIYVCSPEIAFYIEQLFEQMTGDVIAVLKAV